MITKIDINEFLELSKHHPVLDVRSPSEYTHAHIPGAYCLPLFSDEERKIVGTAYKQQSRKNAIKIGLDYFGPKMRRMVEEAENIVEKHLAAPNNKVLLIHCWRGGMRSAGVAWLMDLYGFTVYTLKGGYKAFRTWALAQFDNKYNFHTIGGYTGSGKTPILHELAKRRQAIIDLEGIAHHKGSAFGALGQEKQPTQEMFENKLALALAKLTGHSPIWIEDESRRIGAVNIPEGIWLNMRQNPLFFLDIPQEIRLDLIVNDYGKFANDLLAANIMRIRKKLGGLAAKNALGYLVEGDHKECFRILLNYYDKYYGQDLEKREHLDQILTKVNCDTTLPKTNANKLLLLLAAEATN